MTDWTGHDYTAPDGVKTWYRRYEGAGGAQKTPVICLHGLTRNSRDFEDVAPRIAASGRTVIAVDVRGRGRSSHDPDPDNYHPGTYVSDVLGLLDSLSVSPVISLGTSMGGLMTMMIAAARPGLLKGAVLNDIGPEIDPAGLKRIQGYVGGSGAFKSWDEAAQAVRAINAAAFPDETGAAFWLAFARRVCRETDAGEIVLDYDPAIAKPVKSGDVAPPDLWPFFDALAPLPLLLVRGALTDLLAQRCVEEMQRRSPHMKHVDVPRVGHAPLLTEPEARAAIDAFLAGLD